MQGKLNVGIVGCNTGRLVTPHLVTPVPCILSTHPPSCTSFLGVDGWPMWVTRHSRHLVWVWCDYDSSSHCCCHGIPPVQNLLHNLATTLPPSFPGWTSSREYRVHKARQVSTNPEGWPPQVTDVVGLRVGSSYSSRFTEQNEQYLTVAYSEEYATCDEI